MKYICKYLKKAKETYNGVYASAFILLMTPLPAFSQDVSVEAPLDILKKGREKAASSNLNTDNAKSLFEKWGGLAALGAGLLGILFCIVSGIKLWQAAQNEQSRESIARSLAGIGIAACISIVLIIIGAITTGIAG